MALARFLVGCELSYEAIGVLNNAASTRQTLLSDPEFRGLRGIAKVMAGRLKEAETDFATPVLADDPSTQLWRGYLAAQAGNYAEARQKFAAGLIAQNQFSPIWKARFARADAEAALGLGDMVAAGNRIAEALNERLPPEEGLATRLVQARIMEAGGDDDRALRVYQAIARAPLEQVAAPALLRATQIRLDKGQLTPAQAATVFDGLRFRWRGDANELETIRLLGQLYLNQGRYREALETLRSAGMRLPDLPQALQLQADLAAAFRGLFLDGLADGLEPIQALALFYDFKELTPVGADGDLMVRKLVRRLVDVDLLAAAADLLKYQVDNRLDGVPKAQVATDLALIYLMDRKPENALQAINASRTTLLPNALNTERRIVTARALVGLGRLDAAAEIIEPDKSPEAQDVRAEIAWKQRDWPLSGALFEKSLGERWNQDQPLRADEEGKLLRAGVAYSLAGDDAALTRLRGRYDAFFERSRNPEALRVAFAGMDSGTLTANDFSRAVADNEGFAGWVAKMKQRFREKPAPVTTRTAEAPAPAAKG
jgi:tetratricopeptide (TPR) repeat protein